MPQFLERFGTLMQFNCQPVEKKMAIPSFSSRIPERGQGFKINHTGKHHSLYGNNQVSKYHTMTWILVLCNQSTGPRDVDKISLLYPTQVMEQENRMLFARCNNFKRKRRSYQYKARPGQESSDEEEREETPDTRLGACGSTNCTKNLKADHENHKQTKRLL